MTAGELRQALRHIPDDLQVLMCVDPEELIYRDICYFDLGVMRIDMDKEIIYDICTDPENALCFWPDEPNRIL